MTEHADRIELVRSPNFSRNRERSTDTLEHCAVCGKNVKKPVNYIHLFYGDTVVSEVEAQRIILADDDGGDMGFFPVGNDCLRQHPELKPFIQTFEFSAGDMVRIKESRTFDDVDLQYICDVQQIGNVAGPGKDDCMIVDFPDFPGARLHFGDIYLVDVDRLPEEMNEIIAEWTSEQALLQMAINEGRNDELRTLVGRRESPDGKSSVTVYRIQRRESAQETLIRRNADLLALVRTLWQERDAARAESKLLRDVVREIGNEVAVAPAHLTGGVLCQRINAQVKRAELQKPAPVAPVDEDTLTDLAYNEPDDIIRFPFGRNGGAK